MKGDVIVVRYADDFVVGFQHKWEAESFLNDLSSTLYKICSRPRPENLVCGDFVQSFLEG